jgi:hypothetical protein
MTETREELEQMKKVGFAIFGEDFFKATLAYVQIQRKLAELDMKKENS